MKEVWVLEIDSVPNTALYGIYTSALAARNAAEQLILETGYNREENADVFEELEKNFNVSSDYFNVKLVLFCRKVPLNTRIFPAK